MTVKRDGPSPLFPRALKSSLRASPSADQDFAHLFFCIPIDRLLINSSLSHLTSIHPSSTHTSRLFLSSLLSPLPHSYTPSKKPRLYIMAALQQWSVLLGNDLDNPSTTASATDLDTENASLTQLLVAGEYSLVLKSGPAKEIFGSSLLGADADADTIALNLPAFLSKRIHTYLASPEHSHAASDVLSVGIAALYAFVQAGWTGPEIFEPVELLPASVQDKAKELDDQALENLAVGGETVYHLSPRILFLQMARVLLVEHLQELEKDAAVADTAAWWALRVLFLQQRTLEGPTGLLQDEMMKLSEKTEAALNKKVKTQSMLTRNEKDFTFSRTFADCVTFF